MFMNVHFVCIYICIRRGYTCIYLCICIQTYKQTYTPILNSKESLISLSSIFLDKM